MPNANRNQIIPMESLLPKNKPQLQEEGVFHTAHGRDHQPQENPPGDGEQDDERPALACPTPSDDPRLKEDMSRQVSS